MSSKRPTQAVRDAFKAAGLNYECLTKERLELLRIYIVRELKSHDQKTGFKLTMSEQIQICSDAGQCRISSAFLFVDGPYFKKREAISFNRDGFIGVAGWASQDNVDPIIEGTLKWIQDISRPLPIKYTP